MFRRESGLSWAEIARRLGTYPHTLWRWRNMAVRPSAEHMMALLDLADELGLAHLFTCRTVSSKKPQRKGLKRKKAAYMG